MNHSSILDHAFDPNISLATTASPQLPPTIGQIELYLISTAFGTTWTFGLVSNIIALIALRRMTQTPLNVILISLCCSDIVSILGTPFVIIQFVYATMGIDYPWNRAICKAMYPMLTVTPAVTAHSVLALSIWRMYAIHRPHRASKIMTLERAKRMVMAVWAINIMVIVPVPAYCVDVRYSTYATSMICYYRAHHAWVFRIYNIVEALVNNFIPVTLIIILCVAVGFSLLVQKSKRQKLTRTHKYSKEYKNALLQLALIIVTFLFGDVPKTCYLAFSMLRDYESPRFYAVIFLTSRFLLSFTESVNPIVYNLGSKSIRDSTRRSLQGIFCLCRPPAANGNSEKQQPATKEENIEMGMRHNRIKSGSVP